MALIKCEECGQMVSDKAVACPHCGCPVENQTKSSKSDQNDLEVTDTSLDVSGSPTNEDNYDKPSSEEQELSYDYGQDDSESSWERDIKKRKRLRWIFGIAAVLLTIVGVDAWLYMQTSNDDVEENTVLTQEAANSVVEENTVLTQEAANSVVDMDIDANNSNVSDESETNEKERLERDNKANSIDQFIGSYIFESRKILGRNHYLIVEVLSDGRITTCRSNDVGETSDKSFIGNINKISDHAFMIANAKTFILTDSYNDNKGAATNSNRARDVVFDIRENRTYKNLDAYNNRDISDPTYYEFTRK